MPRLTPELVREMVAAGTLALCSGSGDIADGACCIMQAERLYLGIEDGKDSDPDRRVLTAYCQRLNDRFTDEERARLVPYVAKIAESPKETRAIQQRRAFILADHAVRIFAPLYLDARKQSPEAAKLRALPEIVDVATALNGQHAAADAAYAANAYADSAADAAAYAAAYAADAAYAYADSAADAAARRPAIDKALRLLDRLLEVFA